VLRAESADTDIQSSVPQPLIVDIAAILGQLGDDEELVWELIDLFLTDYPRRVAAIASAVSAHDARGVAAAAHSLKGGASNLCAREVEAAAWELEQAAERSDFAAITASSQQLALRVDEFAAALRAQRQSNSRCASVIVGPR
jgi:HPt (histidine-containing phosphotransfer) domain-containing protein